MGDQYKVKIKLLKNDRPCYQGHKPGDEWEFGKYPPAGLCKFAYSALLPFIEVLKNGGTVPWEKDPNVVTQCCPDHIVNNTFEIRREPESDKRAERYDVTVTLIGKECDGVCGYGHCEGDTWDFSGPQEKVPADMCPSAYKAISDTVLMMRYGGQLPWQPDPDVYVITCPDPEVGNRYELRRKPTK